MAQQRPCAEVPLPAHLRRVELRFTIIDLGPDGTLPGHELWCTLECDLEDPAWISSEALPAIDSSPFHPQPRNQPEHRQ